MPTVSIIIPAYNAGLFLKETVRSVLDQTYSDIEVVICDDGSTDNTAEVAQSFSDPRVRYIRQQNAGVSAARNNGAKHSSGNYLAFLDADDIFYPTNIAKKVDALKKNPEAGMTFADCEVIDAAGKKTGEVLTGKSEDILRNLLLWNGTVIPGPSSVLVTREAFEKINGFDTAFSTAADQDFFFRMAHQFSCIRIPEVLTAYRKHGSNMHMNIALMERDHSAVYAKAARNQLFGTAAFRRKCFGNFYLILAGSWWVNGRSKAKGMRYMLKALGQNPALITKLFRKLV